MALSNLASVLPEAIQRGCLDGANPFHASLSWVGFYFVDVFQIDVDLKEENSSKLLHQEVDEDKPGGGQHYCLHCA